jgi:hypothetical protein
MSTAQQVGGALGLSVLATLATSRTHALRAGGESGAAALTGGYQLAFTVAGGFVATALAVALVALYRRRTAAIPARDTVPVVRSPEQSQECVSA